MHFLLKKFGGFRKKRHLCRRITNKSINSKQLIAYRKDITPNQLVVSNAKFENGERRCTRQTL